MLTRRADDIRRPRRDRIACQDRDQTAGGHISICDAIGEPGDAETCRRRSGKRRGAVGLEPALRLNRDDLVAIHELPGFCSLHEGLMVNELIRGFR
ncbi:hypothetical protein D9M70_594920 [compost metagenome]